MGSTSALEMPGLPAAGATAARISSGGVAATETTRLLSPPAFGARGLRSQRAERPWTLGPRTPCSHLAHAALPTLALWRDAGASETVSTTLSLAIRRTSFGAVFA